jgi:mannan endo-1,4-beta-mannosidase
MQIVNRVLLPLVAAGIVAIGAPSASAARHLGFPSAHMLGLSPASISTIPAEQTEAADVGHALNIINLFVDFDTSAATMTSRWKSASAGGAVPEITWMPCSFAAGCSPTHNPFPLTGIAAGRYDSYLTSVANAAKAFGHPIIIRFAHEMNGNWYPWGEVNGNTPAQFIAAWRHVHGIFAARGATNVYWLWTPNKDGHSLSDFYPGNSYADFVGVDGYNGPEYSHTWMTPTQVFGTSFSQFPSFTDRPVLIGEVGCVEGSSSFPGSKATWITQFVQYLASDPYGVKPVGFVWSEFNSAKKIDTSSSAQAAMKAALAKYWAAAPSR